MPERNECRNQFNNISENKNRILKVRTDRAINGLYDINITRKSPWRHSGERMIEKRVRGD